MTCKYFLFLYFIFSTVALSAQNAVDSVTRIKAFKADSIADIHRTRNRIDSAIFYSKRSLQLSRKINDYASSSLSLIKLGELYERQKKQKDALSYFQSSVSSANQSKDPAIRVKAYDRYIAALRKADKFKEAYFTHVARTQLNDSIAKLVAEQRLREHDQLNQNLESSRTESQQQLRSRENEIATLKTEKDQISQAFIDYQNLSKYIFAGLSVLAIVFLISRIVIKRRLVRERRLNAADENERILIAREIRSDFDHGLSKINLFSQGVYDTPSSAEVKRQAGSIHEISSRLLEDLRDVVWNVKSIQPTLQDLIKEINLYGENYFKDLSVEMVSQNPEKVPDMPVEKATFRTIFLVVKEIFFEVAKQSKAMNVYVSFSLQDDHLNITVKDDGLGLQYDPDDKEDWYQRLKTRLLSIGGLLNVSKEEQGTRLRLDIRLNIPKGQRKLPSKGNG